MSRNINTIDYGYFMKNNDDEVTKYEIEYNLIFPTVKHYAVSYNETITTTPTTYTDSEGTEYSWDNESVELVVTEEEI